jgi:ElaB/YqjD/DUF883 family membrane-anchored ribosome-binding protein
MAASEEREVLQQSLQEHQREFREAFQELKQSARAAADPRDPIREHPVRWMLIGAAVGLWFGWRPSQRGGF